MDSLCEGFNKILNDNNIVVWGTKGCGACVKAKQLLKNKNFAFHEEDLSATDQDIQECVLNVTNSPYVPQIFVNKKFIGGYDHLNYLVVTGLLEDLVGPKQKV